EPVLEQDRLERAAPVDMAELGSLNVERDRILGLQDLLRRDVEKLRVRVDEPPDEPRTRDAVDGGVLSGHKAHVVTPFPHGGRRAPRPSGGPRRNGLVPWPARARA